MKHSYLIQLVNEHPLAILPVKLQQIEAFLQYRIAGGPAPQYQAAAGSGYRVSGGVAVIPIFGVISKRIGMLEEMSGGASIDSVMAKFREAMADPSVTSIVLQIDSPGGSVYGIQEAATEIAAARGQKRIVAHADAMAASAAYWLGTAADEFVVTPSGEVGSVGVVAMHVDYSGALETDGVKVSYIHAGEHKVEGNPYQPLGEDARAFMQQRVDEYYEAFVGAVAKNRGIKAATVQKEFGQGRVYGAQQAKAVGMIDRIATLSETIQSLMPRAKRRTAQAQAEASIAEAILKAS